MLKTKWKMIVLITIISLMVTFNFTVAFATTADVATTDDTTSQTTDEDVSLISENSTDQNAVEDETSTEDSSEQEVYKDDLYLIDNNVVMDKLVDGNVYILANTVEITGQVNGNLYVCANNISFNGSYVRYSIYACANTIDFDAACNDLYVACNSMNVTYDSYIVRDIRAISKSMKFIGAVGRNAYITADSLSFGDEATDDEQSKLALIYGNLNYISPSEITIPDGIVEGDTTYTASSNVNSNSSISATIYDYIISLAKCLLFTFAIFFLMLWLTPKFVDKSSEFVSKKMAIGLGLGILSIIAAIIIFFLLTFSIIGSSVAMAFITSYILLVSFGFATVCIGLTSKFAKDAKLGKKLGTLAITTIILWVLTKIPAIGTFIWFIITFAGTGYILFYTFTKNSSKKKIETSTTQD